MSTTREPLNLEPDDESQRATRGVVFIGGVEYHALYPEQLAAFNDGLRRAGDLAAAFRAASRRRLAHDLFRVLVPVRRRRPGPIELFHEASSRRLTAAIRRMVRRS